MLNNASRFSVGSAGSGSSDQYSQYLVVHHRDSMNPEERTPMSVRPFSPSESFAFPKPPPTDGDRTSMFSGGSRPQSSITLATPKSARGSTYALSHPSLPPTPSLPTSNPFDDPAPTSPKPINGSTEFQDIETIRRPFVPTLNDELAVSIGERVKIVYLFDDGWAMVERLASLAPGDAKGKSKYVEEIGGEQGLIPIDCLRDAGEDLPTFLTNKRVSSYSQATGNDHGTAL
ncbi:hypothetical protein BDQ12DRAFT_613939 [Crucibulum laeve]|uniref:SH3 domain-containing protein n=1 Tax=Crucibulum laeve TaxID=68775 RepID=A0A5C3LN83_9AGAR|nr:hypothetical protein BDQ12DRAFT_613939 [Crucibulum laeve]